MSKKKTYFLSVEMHSATTGLKYQFYAVIKNKNPNKWKVLKVNLKCAIKGGNKRHGVTDMVIFKILAFNKL